MTTEEATIALISRLSEPEMLDVQNYINKRIFARKKKAPLLVRYSKSELIAELEQSYLESQRGDSAPVADFLAEVCEVYDLSV